MLKILVLEQIVLPSSENCVAPRFKASKDGSACKRLMALAMSFQVCAGVESFGAPSVSTAVPLFVFEADVSALSVMVSLLVTEFAR